MSNFSCHSARVRTRQQGGLHVAEYRGFLNGHAWRELGRHVERERRPGIAGVNLIYAAVHDTSDYLDHVDLGYLAGAEPSVWIVRPDQHQAALHIARRLADIGVTQTVFLQAFESLALEFAARQCPVSR